MWPSKHQLGVQLVYGTQGNGVVTAEEVPSALEGLPSFQPNIHFPRLRDQGPLLRPIKNSSWKLPSYEHDEESQVSTSMAWLRKKTHSTTFFPDELTEALLAELAPMNDLLAYDPTEGDQMTLVDLGIGAFADPVLLEGHKILPNVKNSVVNLKGVAYVCGENSSELRLAPLLPRVKRVTCSDTGDTSKLYLPDSLQDRANYACCRFPNRILQIQASPFHSLIAVRSKATIHFVKYSWQNNPHIRAPEFDVLPCSIDAHDFSASDLAHFEFSPMDKNAFTIIDVQGKFSVWRFHERTKTTELVHTSIPSGKPESKTPLTIANTEDTSSWKSICWCSDSQSLIAFSRKEATCFHVGSDYSMPVQSLITSNLWASIWDVKTCSGYAFLLTSREIMFLKLGVKAPLARLVSWKHYLDNEDPSFKLRVFKADKNLFICSVFSKNMPMAMMYTFGFHDGKPSLLNDPYCIRTDENCKDLYLDKIVYDGTDTLTFCQIQTTKSEIQFSSIHGTKLLEMDVSLTPSQSASVEDSQTTEDIFTMISIAEATNAFHSFSTADRMAHENEEIWEDEHAQVSPVQLVQNYAFRLGNDIKKRFKIEEEIPEDPDSDTSNGSAIKSSDYIPKFIPLSTIADCVPVTIDDMEEFDSMTDQLNDFYESCGVKVHKDIKRFLRGLGSFDDISVKSLSEALEMACPDHPNVNQAAMILVNSLYKVSNEDIETRLQNLYREELKSCDSELATMFDEWDIQIPRERAKSAPPTVDTKKRGLLHRALTQNSQQMSQLTSHVSQAPQDSQLSQTQRPSSSPEVPEIMLSQSTAPSQSKPGPSRLSQKTKRPGSQSTSQRKKKKKGGFA